RFSYFLNTVALCPNTEIQICVKLSFDPTESSIELITNEKYVRVHGFGTQHEAFLFCKTPLLPHRHGALDSRTYRIDYNEVKDPGRATETSPTHGHESVGHPLPRTVLNAMLRAPSGGAGAWGGQTT